MFLAVHDGEVIGRAGLERGPDQPARAEHGLTAVRRDRRGQGIAACLKRYILRWAEVPSWSAATTVRRPGRSTPDRAGGRRRAHSSSCGSGCRPHHRGTAEAATSRAAAISGRVMPGLASNPGKAACSRRVNRQSHVNRLASPDASPTWRRARWKCSPGSGTLGTDASTEHPVLGGDPPPCAEGRIGA
jgi:hypothetical protein